MSAHGSNRRTTLRWLIAATIVGSSAMAFAAPAGGPDAKLEITVFKGTKASASAIPSGWPGLASAPFNAYNSYVEVDKQTIDLTKGKTVTGTFSGGSLEATLIDTTPKPKFELVIKDAKGVQLVKGTYSTPKGTPILPAIINSANQAIVPGLKVL
ncbi:MAG: hypothetical protein ACXVEF_07760 [Polyangiales bacterium]